MISWSIGSRDNDCMHAMLALGECASSHAYCHVASNESKINDQPLSWMRLAHAWDRMWWEAWGRSIYHDIVWGEHVHHHVRWELPTSRSSVRC